MPKAVYNEFYGEVTTSVLSAIKRYNVSPSDFQTLRDAGVAMRDMRDTIVSNSRNGMFQVYLFLQNCNSDDADKSLSLWHTGGTDPDGVDWHYQWWAENEAHAIEQHRIAWPEETVRFAFKEE